MSRKSRNKQRQGDLNNKKVPINEPKKEILVKTEPKPIGRPTTYTEEVASEICERLSKGETLRSICKEPNMPGVTTVHDWRKKSKEFSVCFAQAREEGFEAIAEECLEIADDGSNDYMTITKGDVEYNVEDREVTNRSKLRVETRLKLLAKWFPQKYGEKVDVTSGGEKIQQTSPEQLKEIADLINSNAKK